MFGHDIKLEAYAKTKEIELKLGKLSQELSDGVAAVDEALEACEKERSLSKRAKYLAGKGVQALSELRSACDRTEELVEHQLWPLPKYREMLFPL